MAPIVSGEQHVVQVHQAGGLPLPCHPYRFRSSVPLGNHQRDQQFYSCMGVGSCPEVPYNVVLCSCTSHHGATSRNLYTTGRCSCSYLQADSRARQPNWTICKELCWSGLWSANHISIMVQQSGVSIVSCCVILYLLVCSIVNNAHVVHRLVTGLVGEYGRYRLSFVLYTRKLSFRFTERGSVQVTSIHSYNTHWV